MLNKLKSELRQLSNAKKAAALQRFFKTGKGQYGEGDIFLGATVPLQRTLAKKYWKDLSLVDLDKLIRSKIHEERLVALLILANKYQKQNSLPPQEMGRETSFAKSGRDGERLKKQIFNFYLSHIKYINNWDLVDLSAPNIVGAHLFSLPKSGEGSRERLKDNVLLKLTKSKNLWERRIAILATFYFIYRKQPQDTLKIATMLLKDNHDLIHKAVGWMLREVGKRCGEKYLLNFLDRYCKQMPRVMLRYAIERLPEKKRKKYLNML